MATDPNQRVLWWEERIRQENKAMVKLIKARRKAGEDPERTSARNELARKLKETKSALAEERIARYRAEQEVRELEALAKKAEELGRDPILLAKEKNSGSGVAAAFK